VNDKNGAEQGTDEIDFDRVLVDQDYRRKVIEQLNAAGQEDDVPAEQEGTS
jgi:hypothetical protein